jgi:hypothetical protein
MVSVRGRRRSRRDNRLLRSLGVDGDSTEGRGTASDSTTSISGSASKLAKGANRFVVVSREGGDAAAD